MIQNINHTFPVPRAYIASCFSTRRPPQGSLPAPNRWYPLLPLNLHKEKRPGIVPHAFNPSTHPEDRGRWISVGTGPACSTHVNSRTATAYTERPVSKEEKEKRQHWLKKQQQHNPSRCLHHVPGPHCALLLHPPKAPSSLAQWLARKVYTSFPSDSGKCNLCRWSILSQSPLENATELIQYGSNTQQVTSFSRTI